MNNRSMKSARKLMRKAVKSVDADNRNRYRLPLWRKVLGWLERVLYHMEKPWTSMSYAPEPHVERVYRERWERRHAAAIKAAMKKSSQQVARGQTW